MLYLVIVLHTLLSVGLVAAILLHRGQGGGLASTFGGGLASTFGGTGVIEKNLDRITIVLAVSYVLTSITLVVLV